MFPKDLHMVGLRVVHFWWLERPKDDEFAYNCKSHHHWFWLDYLRHDVFCISTRTNNFFGLLLECFEGDFDHNIVFCKVNHHCQFQLEPIGLNPHILLINALDFHCISINYEILKLLRNFRSCTPRG